MNEDFLKWFDKFSKRLVETPYLGNMGAPIIPTTSLLSCLNEYLEMRNNDNRIRRRKDIINDVSSEGDRIKELEDRIEILEKIIKNKK